MALDFLGSLIAGAGIGFQTRAAYDAAKAQNLAAEWNAGIARQNADDLDSLAANQRLLGEKAAGDLRRHVAGVIGEQRAVTGASGVKVDAGSSAVAQASTAAMGEYDAQTLLYNHEMQAMDFQRQARNQRSQASLMLATKQNPWLAAAAPAVTGYSNLWHHYGQQSYVDRRMGMGG